MSKYQGSLLTLYNIATKDGTDEYIELMRDELQELVAKETTMKVNQTWEEEDNHVYICPNCKDTWFYCNDNNEWNYCPNCGQHLDWGKDNE